jgi:hypothetical protein
MSHDPYQTQATLGMFSGLTNPFSSPYGVMQTSGINPVLAVNPLAANAGAAWGQTVFAGQQPGVQGYAGGISPQQLQLASILASQAAQMSGLSPFGNAWQNPFINAGLQHNPLAQAALQSQVAQVALQNPMIAAALQNQLAAIAQQNQLAAIAQQNPYANPYQQGNPYQQANPFQQYGQFASAFGQPVAQFNNPFVQPTLAPQSWVGQAQIGQHGQAGAHQGYVNPLVLQSVARAIQQSQGISPWGTF